MHTAVARRRRKSAVNHVRQAAGVAYHCVRSTDSRMLQHHKSQAHSNV